MASYTYTIFDGDPNVSCPCALPGHEGVELEAADDEDAADKVSSLLEVVADGLSPADGYDVGQRIYALIWDDRGIVVAALSCELL